MKTRIAMLKVKIKSLAEEARIIRHEERRALCRELPTEQRAKYRDLPLFEELRMHRVNDVRREQRASLLAYAFLRGKPLAACEPNTVARSTGWQCIDWVRILQLVMKFGPAIPGETETALKERRTQTDTQLQEWRSATLAAV